MKTKCKYCGVQTVNPCKTVAEMKAYIDKGLPLSRCAAAHERATTPAATLEATVTDADAPAAERIAAGSEILKRAVRQAEEDAFALPPQRASVSDTAKAQMAMRDLSRYGAPSPFEHGLMMENAARGIRALEMRPEDAREAAIEAKRQRLEAEGAKIEWAGDYPSARRVSTTEGVKFDNGKLRFDLIPPDALAMLAAVLTYGAAKYDDRNWELGMDRARLRAARARHENARLLGLQMDSETGLPHLAHEAACTMMELALWLRGMGSDSAAEIPEASRAAVEQYGTKAVREGRLAAAKKGAQHG